jgi:hypothetical protein
MIITMSRDNNFNNPTTEVDELDEVKAQIEVPLYARDVRRKIEEILDKKRMREELGEFD